VDVGTGSSQARLISVVVHSGRSVVKSAEERERPLEQLGRLRLDGLPQLPSVSTLYLGRHDASRFLNRIIRSSVISLTVKCDPCRGVSGFVHFSIASVVL